MDGVAVFIKRIVPTGGTDLALLADINFLVEDDGTFITQDDLTQITDREVS